MYDPEEALDHIDDAADCLEQAIDCLDEDHNKRICNQLRVFLRNLESVREACADLLPQEPPFEAPEEDDVPF